jgi:hypothetical protein
MSKQKEDEKSDKISSFSNFSQKKHNYYLVLSYKQAKSIKILSDDDVWATIRRFLR